MRELAVQRDEPVERRRAARFRTQARERIGAQAFGGRPRSKATMGIPSAIASPTTYEKVSGHTDGKSTTLTAFDSIRPASSSRWYAPVTRRRGDLRRECSTPITTTRTSSESRSIRSMISSITCAPFCGLISPITPTTRGAVGSTRGRRVGVKSIVCGTTVALAGSSRG